MDDIMTAAQAAESGKELSFDIVWAALMETRKQMQESHEELKELVADVTKNLGGLGNTLGKFTESMFQAELWEKFNELGYTFSKQSPYVKYYENNQVLTEVDFFLENGDIAMPVEIKTELTTNDVDEHIERIEKIRHYMDARNDSRKLVGAVAGGIVPENVLNYAHKKGFTLLCKRVILLLFL